MLDSCVRHGVLLYIPSKIHDDIDQIASDCRDTAVVGSRERPLLALFHNLVPLFPLRARADHLNLVAPQGAGDRRMTAMGHKQAKSEAHLVCCWVGASHERQQSS